MAVENQLVENQLVEIQWKLKTKGIGHNLQYRSRTFYVVNGQTQIGDWTEWMDIPVCMDE